MTDTCHFLPAPSVRILTKSPLLQVQWTELRLSVVWVKVFSQRLPSSLMRSQKPGLSSFPAELLFRRGCPCCPCLSCVTDAQQLCQCPGSYRFILGPPGTFGHGFLAWSQTYLARIDLSGCHCTEPVPGHCLWAWFWPWLALAPCQRRAILCLPCIHPWVLAPSAW